MSIAGAKVAAKNESRKEASHTETQRDTSISNIFPVHFLR